jgi:hypothetical protein
MNEYGNFIGIISYIERNVDKRDLLMMTEVGSKIQLIRPDQSIIETQIRGITFSDKHDILVGENVKKEDVPLGTEVWLMDTN